MFFSLAIFLVVAGTVILEMKTWHPLWWRMRWVRVVVWGIGGAGLVGVGLRMMGMSQAAGSGRMPGVTIAGASLLGPASVFALMLFFSLPLAAILRRILRFGDRRLLARIAKKESIGESSPSDDAKSSVDEPVEKEEPQLVGRRAVLEGVVAVLPVATLGAGVLGVAGAYARTRVAPLPMRFAKLPSDLQGIKILQLTDLHLGAFLDLGGLEAILDDAQAQAPDLVLITGDLSDHLPWLAPALTRVEALKPRLGAFGVFGNHEHYRGAAAAHRIYDASGVHLLLDRHQTIRVGETDLTLVGVDDPARGDAGDFYGKAINLALDGAPSDSFKLGLCHRPSGFGVLAGKGIDLTLSGHTHGAQVGVGGRSILEGAVPGARLWGRYAIGERQLYTSSGAGHWFAFRLNCPSEAPIVTLERA